MAPGADVEEVFAACAVERRALADLLDGLDRAQWAARSLCSGWDVRTVAGHLLTAISPEPLPALLELVRSGGRLHRANDAMARRSARRSPEAIVAGLRHHAGARTRPPVTGARGPLVDVLVHTADISVPLGLAHDPLPGGVRAGLDLATTGHPVGFVPRGLLRGLRLVADDLGDAWGSGDVVSGRGIHLLVAACGRDAVLPRLHGPGADVLQQRLAGRHR